MTTLYAQWTDAKSMTEAYALEPGATYFFDLSAQSSQLGTPNAALPDGTLRFVPFTYAGTINAYGTANTTAYTHSLLIADYVVGTNVAGNSLSGKSSLQNGAFTMRLPTGGSKQSWVQNTDGWGTYRQRITAPGNNESPWTRTASMRR